MNKDPLARALPFGVYLGFLLIEDGLPSLFGTQIDWRWLYPLKVVAVALVLAVFWRHYGELRGRQAWPTGRDLLLALLAGLVVFGLWINLADGWAVSGELGQGYRSLDDEGRLVMPLLLARLLGACLLVPLIEELFWRSLVMRWLDRPAFLELARRR
jgi:CAAX prenyl protease-like protein